ncbi:dTMP kinase [Paeniglutamicibacter cryotolerans]|nr:dTMP kinase [Paeniglutamicibacter cryotolerans]
MFPGRFIVFEGGDGAGKSTQARLLADFLRGAGREVLPTREPGGTEIGERLRSLVLDHGQGAVDARTEALIFAAARAAHVQQVIVPALEAGNIVISDRYVDSSIAYQGVGRGLGTGDVACINEWATGGLLPDLTVLLDVSATAGRARRTAGEAAEDRMESEPDDFHMRIRAAFAALAAAAPERYLVLDAGAPIAELATSIHARVAGL